MRQRAGIAQAILHEPAVLFLDEPTSGLDPQGVAKLREIIIGLNQDLGMTVFMNTHLLAEVTRTCTSIGILSSGRLIYQDSVAAEPGLEIAQAMAENNIDPQSGAAVADRLRFTLTNASTAHVNNLDVHYTMKDSTTGQTESYYHKLDGLTLAPGKSTTVYFDNGTGPGHYPENKYSLYRISINEVRIRIEAAAPGFAPAAATAVKAQGTEEKID